MDFIQRLKQGPVVGDGSYVFTLEKRGYVMAGPWTPEAVLEFPDAVRQLHKDYLRAGSDVIQAFTFYATGDKMKSATGVDHDVHELNDKACMLAHEVADPGNAFVCGGISPTPMYTDKIGTKKTVQAEFQKQLDAFKNNKIDLVLAEFFAHIEETEWAIEVLKTFGKPVAATMRIGPKGDLHGVSAGDCAVRMARAGADIVGVNCCFDIATSLKTIRLMKTSLADAGLDPFLMTQPCGYHCPDCENSPNGYMNLPEYPLALEPRLFTRWDVRQYAREAFELGVRYMGGCCGFEPYHIREMAEELAEERGKRPPGADKNEPWGARNADSMFSFIRGRSTKDYWTNLKPSFGRPDCPILGKPVDE